ncbi:hypothetical protein C2I06_12915 [Niallia circulans]|nr:hypothetical protein C2I06_12915 [Niallia circulans]AYV73958.1 hypothetical protein C2H98_21665 [Niallia circulans]
MGPDSCKSADKRQHSFFALISKIQHFGKTTLSRKNMKENSILVVKSQSIKDLLARSCMLAKK